MSIAIVAEARFANVSTYLAWDHDRLDAILNDVVEMVEDGELERADYLFGDFYQGLTRHIRLEEEIVFPLFEARTGAIGPTHVMRHEHCAIEAALELMRAALDRHDAEDFQTGLEQLQAVLPDHNAKEEQILYPATDRALSPDERVALASRLAGS